MTFGLVAACVAIAALAALVLIDPYGAGRLLPKQLDRPLALGANPAFSSAARLRNPAFDAFILGNSTSQTLDPDRLNALTGRTFGQTTVPGTGPLEQSAMLGYLGRVRGGGVKALVLGLDFTWCDPAWMTRGKNPFPLWLYDASLPRYLVGLFRFNSLEALPPRISSLAGWAKPPRADGFWNYELHVPPRPYPYPTPQVAAAKGPERSAAPSLQRALGALHPEARVTIVLSPMYRAPDDPRDFDTATGAAACRHELVAAAGNRPNTKIIDFWRDGELNRDRANFLDAVHFRAPIARAVEEAIAAGLR